MPKRKKSDAQGLDYDEIFSGFGGEEEEGEGEGEGEGENSLEKRLDAALATIGQLQTQVTSQNDTFVRMMAGGHQPVQAPAQQASQPKVPQVNLQGLPDPAVDPEGYQAGLSQRMGEAIQAGIQNFTTTATQQQALEQEARESKDALWRDFTNQYKDLAEDTDAIEFAATKVLKRAKARGLDPQRYMLGATRDQFLKDVADETRKFIPVASEEAEEEGEEEDGERTDGIFGAQGVGDGEGKGKKKAEKREPGLIEELGALQAAGGYV